MVTNSRKMFRLPITSRVCSPLNFRSCGIRPIEANGKISVSSPISVQPSIDGRRADRAVRADPDVRRRSSACGPMVVPSPTYGRTDATIAVGWISVRVGDEPEQQLALGHDLIVDDTPSPARARASARRLPSETSSRSRSPGHHLPPELRVVDAAQVDACVRRRRRRAREQDRRHLRRATRASAPPASAARPGKCPWKNSSLTVTFFTATSRRPARAR